MRSSTALRIAAAGFLLLLVACPKVERSTGKALEQANEVIDHTSKKIFVEPNQAGGTEEPVKGDEDKKTRSFGEDGSDEQYY